MANGGSADGPSKGNEYAFEALKQVLTLAGAILALTITFLKDALGDARTDARWTFLVPLSWGLLIVVIWTAWISLAEAAKQVGTSTATVGYVFAKGTTARTLARTAQFCFAIALTALGIFAISNFSLYFRPVPAGEDAGRGGETQEDGAGVGAPRLDLIGRVGPFRTGSPDALEPGAVEPSQIAARLKSRPTSGEVLQVVVVGSADKFPLGSAQRARFGSNAGLARARADWVGTRLGDGVGQGFTYTALTVGPREHGAGLSHTETAADRTVAIYLPAGGR